jgi:HAMP domain-containing protein
MAIEIQVHNLEAARRVKNYLSEQEVPGAEKKRRMYLEESKFEINEIQSLASKAMAIAPTPQTRTKFTKITEAAAQFGQAVDNVVQSSKSGVDSGIVKAAVAAYEDAAEELHESAEDGEIVGHDASQTSLEAIDRTSSRSVALVVGISILGLALGIVVSYKLSRAILIPVDHLKEVAENVSLGNLDVAVRRYSEDEIGDLADSFSRMVTAVKFFRMEAEQVQADPIEQVKL